MTETELRRDLASKRLRKVYLFYGTEQYSLRATVGRIASMTVGQDDPFNRSDFDGAVPFQEVYDAAVSLPFMAEKRLVIWRDAPILKPQKGKEEENGGKEKSDSSMKMMMSLLTDLPDTTVLILWAETIEIDSKRPSAKLKKLAEAVEQADGIVTAFERRTTAEISKLLVDGASRRGCRMQPSTASYMIDYCGDDLATLVSELDKVCAYAHGETVTTDTVREVCTKNVDVSIYELSKAVLSLNMERAFCVLDDLLFAKTPALYILGTLSSAFVDIYRAKAAEKMGVNPGDTAADFGMKGKEFRMNYAARDGRKLNDAGIRECLLALAKADKELKSSRMAEQVVLETLLTDLGRTISKCR